MQQVNRKGFVLFSYLECAPRVVSFQEHVYIRAAKAIKSSFFHYLYHSTMLAKTMLLPILIVVFFSVSHCNGDTCSCTCCTGNFCTPTFQGTVPVSSCGSSSCKSVCQSNYPSQCTDGPGRTSYECRGGSSTSPNWAGVFRMTNRCDTRTCCCPVGQMTLSKVGGNALRIQCQFSGQCPPGTSSVDDTVSMPTGYSAQIAFMDDAILVTLSQDSRTIQLTNVLYPSCSETATRSGALSATTINLAFLFVSSGLMSLRQLMI